MAKYIDVNLLQEKITEQMESLPREVGRGAGTITSKSYGMMQAFQIMRSIIDSLQQEQPEVELEKEINKAMKSDLCPEEISCYDFGCIARHFYKLGLNAKEENK